MLGQLLRVLGSGGQLLIAIARAVLRYCRKALPPPRTSQVRPSYPRASGIDLVRVPSQPLVYPTLLSSFQSRYCPVVRLRTGGPVAESWKRIASPTGRAQPIGSVSGTNVSWPLGKRRSCSPEVIASSAHSRLGLAITQPRLSKARQTQRDQPHAVAGEHGVSPLDTIGLRR